MMKRNLITLHDKDGQRKYLNQAERIRFLDAAKSQTTAIRLFCQLLYYTGARIAEIHNLTRDSIDLPNGTIIIECLKKRKSGIYREIPLRPDLLNDLQSYSHKYSCAKTNLWPFSLRTASRQIKAVMQAANINGTRSCARGLRHGFAVHAVTGAPLNMVKKWLGHSELETTEIYTNAIGQEEREIAKRSIWQSYNINYTKGTKAMNRIISLNKMFLKLETDLIQIIGLVEALNELDINHGPALCVIKSLDESMASFHENFYQHRILVASYYPLLQCD